MNQTVRSDDELLDLLERTMRSVAEAAPAMAADDEPRSRRWPVTAAAALVAVAGIGGIFVASQRAAEPAGPTANAPSATADVVPPDTHPVDAQHPTPIQGFVDDFVLPVLSREQLSAGPLDSVPGDFPTSVPVPAEFDYLQLMSWENNPGEMVRVGWEFYAKDESDQRAERCGEYATTLGDRWAGTPKTDEDPFVVYAQLFKNLDVPDIELGVYCTANGEFLVQVLQLDVIAHMLPTGVPRSTPDNAATTSPNPVPEGPKADLSQQVAYRVSSGGEQLASLGFPNNEYTIDGDGVTTVTASDPARPNERIITIVMTPGTMLQPEDHSRTPVTVVEETSSLIRVENHSNDGWTFSVEFVDTGNGPLATVEQLQELIYSIDP